MMAGGNGGNGGNGTARGPQHMPAQVPMTNIHVPSHFQVTPFVHDENQRCMRKYYYMTVVVMFLLVLLLLGGLYWIFRRPIVEAVSSAV